MGTIFCKNCGQANSSFEYSCTKCGLNLGNPSPNLSNKSPFGASEDDPYKTIVVGQNDIDQAINTASSTQTPTNNTAKKSNKLYWILGGVGALVLVGGFLLVALIGGIYLYSSGGDEEIARDYPRNEEPENPPAGREKDDTPSDFPGSDGELTDAKVVEFLDKRKNIGSFKLISANTQDTLKLPTKVFVLSEASAYSTYLSNRGKNAVVVFMGVYNSAKTSKSDYDLTIRNIKTNGSKNVKTASEDGNNVATFSNKGQNMMLTCRDKVCFMISSNKADALKDFVENFVKELP